MKAEFIKSAFFEKDYPDTELPEIAFVGRSNVGKSSMINTLTNRKKLVKVSQKPGKTRAINFFNINDKIIFVDLPGYGYAKVSKKEREKWKFIIETYLLKRKQLKCVVLIIDIRIGPTEYDMMMLEWLEAYSIDTVIALTKSDKLSNNKIAKQKREIAVKLGMDEDRFVIFSSITRRGRDELLQIIEEKAFS
ncbi:YihA family ribosome biogenesis GTP-binding protein [Deferribacter autotrophicus]|uniref:Probable GTP-binding protein EngB n=1 Tax=Deferribacter autotrophicus TaxID=500465 RepID=A0A5A8F8U0_9BACT|nr:ribosome biogenesis GTP-binding protein YihA/YsxC [Deferribacter autotrophicus]KAA0259022.1 YihA family ribosome biogenesis GTP-binding protein [Deferribacter autotrophicus]